MFKVINQGTAGFGIQQTTMLKKDWYPIRWLLVCGHMISDWHKECSCQPKSG